MTSILMWMYSNLFLQTYLCKDKTIFIFKNQNKNFKTVFLISFLVKTSTWKKKFDDIFIKRSLKCCIQKYLAKLKNNFLKFETFSFICRHTTLLYCRNIAKEWKSVVSQNRFPSLFAVVTFLKNVQPPIPKPRFYARFK